MPEFKEKPGPGKRGKARSPGAALPRQAARQMKEKTIRERKQPTEETEPRNGYAEERVEQAGRWAVEELAGTAAPTRRARKPGDPKKEEAPTDQEAGPDAPADAARTEEQPPRANQPKERKAVEQRKREGGQAGSSAAPRPRREPSPKERPGTRERPGGNGPDTPTGPGPRQAAGTPPAPSRSDRGGSPPDPFPLNNRRRGSAASHQAGSSGGQGAAQHASGKAVRQNTRRGAAPKQGGAPGKRVRHEFKTRPGFRGGPRPGSPTRPAVPPGPAVPRLAGGPTRQRVGRQTVQTVQKAGKGVFALAKKLPAAVIRAASALVHSLAALLGGGVLLVALVIIIVIAAVANSPFGLFFAQERNAPGALSVAEAVNTVNIAYNAQLEQLQTDGYDDIVIQGQAADWPEVLAVFAARYAGADDGVDVATLDPDRVEKLTAVFWDMTEISSWVETIDHPGGEDSEGWTEYILHITISAKTADEMRTAYVFTDYQNSALDELLADRAALSTLAGSLSISNADARAVLDALPADLSPERRAVVETALTLYGKVGYFWGGKSLVLGWDSRWGQLTKVTAAGSSTTGTYRPYGLDCSGYVDWVFYNMSAGEYVIGHGGGAHAQHTYCAPISWDEAQPGDLVFYPGDEHVGIVCGRDESGGLLVIHCASGANNVVITGISGFTSVARPVFYGE